MGALIEGSPIQMSAEAFDAFTESLSVAATPVPALVELFRRPAPWEQLGPASESDTPAGAVIKGYPDGREPNRFDQEGEPRDPRSVQPRPDQD